MMGDNSFDLVVGTILLLIILFSFLKGFARDFSSTVCWVSAALISYFFGPVLFNIFKIHIDNAYLAKVVSYSILFIITLIIIYILVSKLLRPLLSKIPDVIDRSLGLFFGVFKGYIMLCLMFGAFVKISNSHIFYFLNKTKEASGGGALNWSSNSKSYPILEFGASKLSFLFDNISSDFLERNSDSNVKVKDFDDNKLMDNNFDKGLKSGSKKLSIKKNAVKSGGYKSNEIRKMDRLIDVIDNIDDSSSEDGADKSSARDTNRRFVSNLGSRYAPTFASIGGGKIDNGKFEVSEVSNSEVTTITSVKNDSIDISKSASLLNNNSESKDFDPDNPDLNDIDWGGVTIVNNPDESYLNNLVKQLNIMRDFRDNLFGGKVDIESDPMNIIIDRTTEIVELENELEGGE